MSCVGKHFSGIFLKHGHIPLSDRPVKLSGLAETASSDTAPLNLKHHPVLRHFDEWHHRFVRVMGVGHIHHNLFENGVRRLIIQLTALFDRAVFLIDLFIKPRHIDTGNLGGTFQKVQAGTAIFSVCQIPVKKGTVLGLALSDIEQIEEISDGLRVITAGAAANDDGHGFISVFCKKGNLRQIQYLQDIGVAHFIL